MRKTSPVWKARRTSELNAGLPQESIQKINSRIENKIKNNSNQKYLFRYSLKSFAYGLEQEAQKGRYIITNNNK